MDPYDMDPYDIDPYDMGPYDTDPYDMDPYDMDHTSREIAWILRISSRFKYGPYNMGGYLVTLRNGNWQY